MGPGVKLMASSLAAASLRAEPFLQADKYSLILRRGVKFHPSTVKINGRKEGGSYLLVPHPVSGLCGPHCCQQEQQDSGWICKDLSHVD